jgi:hypothetical protein
MQIAAAELRTDAILPIEPRRFTVPDLETHGQWLFDRLCETHKHMTPRVAGNFLRGIVYANDFMFLFLPGAVALAQTSRDVTFDPIPVVRERFVWCRERRNELQHEQALQFYDEFAKWARHQGCETMYVLESSDVPAEKVKDRLGRLFMRQQQFVRL